MTAVAPGRVNLIGDHTDTTGGLVLPMAVDLATTVTGEVGGHQVVLTSATEADPAAVPLEVTDPAAVTPAWARYVAGVVAELRPAAGFTGTVTTTLPVGAGLSSSAALEVAVALALGFEGTPLELAELTRRAEHRASGVPCGIMDQLASAAGVAGHALLIDCHALTVEPVPLPEGLEVRVVHSGQPRELAGSAYAERTAALRSGDLAALGPLMAASHASLRDDFEVSTPVLDALVDRLTSTPGVLGARLTGAGFGGCVVALTEPGALEEGWKVEAAQGAARL